METEYDERSPLLSSGTRAGGSPSSHSFFSAISRFCIKLYKLMEPLIQPHQSNMMIVLLVVATCSERLLFKVVANKMVPYR